MPSKYHLKNDAWFVLSKSSVSKCIEFITNHKQLYITISNGIIANESIFAIMLKSQGLLVGVINESSHATDWTRRMTPTSPYLFKYGSTHDVDFIKDSLKKNKYTIFLRKVDPEFPDNILQKFITD